MLFHGPTCVFGIDQVPHLVPLVGASVQPGTNAQPLFAPRPWATPVLTSDETGNRPLVHEIVPTANRQAGNIHLVKMASAIFLLPVLVVMRMLVPFAEKCIAIAWIATNSRHSFKAARARGTTNPISFFKKAQPRIDHILANQVWGLRDRQVVLCITTLGTAKCPYLSRTPLLLRQPFTHIVAILQLTPL